MLLKFEITKQSVIRTDSEQPASDSRNYLKAKFDFLTPEWDGLIKSAVFWKGSKAYVQILDENNICFVPPIVISPGYFYVSCFAGDLITSEKIKVRISESGYAKGIAPPEPEADTYQKILDMYLEIKRLVQSVRDDADAGAFNGEQGPPGPPGESSEEALKDSDHIEWLNNSYDNDTGELIPPRQPYAYCGDKFKFKNNVQYSVSFKNNNLFYLDLFVWDNEGNYLGMQECGSNILNMKFIPNNEYTYAFATHDSRNIPDDIVIEESVILNSVSKIDIEINGETSFIKSGNNVYIDITSVFDGTGVTNDTSLSRALRCSNHMLRFYTGGTSTEDKSFSGFTLGFYGTKIAQLKVNGFETVESAQDYFTENPIVLTLNGEVENNSYLYVNYDSMVNYVDSKGFSTLSKSDIIKDDVLSNDSTYSSNKINSIFSKLLNMQIVSTEEEFEDFLSNMNTHTLYLINNAIFGHEYYDSDCYVEIIVTEVGENFQFEIVGSTAIAEGVVRQYTYSKQELDNYGVKNIPSPLWINGVALLDVYGAASKHRELNFVDENNQHFAETTKNNILTVHFPIDKNKTYAEQTSIVTYDNSNVDIALENCTEYRCSTPLKSLTLTVPDNLTHSEIFECSLMLSVFDSAYNDFTFTAPENISWSGDDCADKVFTPQKGRCYEINIKFAGVFNSSRKFVAKVTAF